MFFLAVTCLGIIAAGLQKALGKSGYAQQKQQRIITVTVLVMAAWVVLIGLLAVKGFFSKFNTLPPRPVLLIFLPLPVVLVIAFSKKFAAVLKAVPPHWLVGMQAFRIAVELILYYGFANGLLPKQMTFEGGNFDILSGLLAIPVAVMVRKKYSLALVRVFNIIGQLLLLNVLVIVVLSLPTPLRHFMNEPGVGIVGEFPFMYLPGVLVVIAYSLHIFSLRQAVLLSNKKAGETAKAEGVN